MKQLTVNIFQFDELTKESQQVALDNHRDINIEHDWWDFDFEFFIELMESIAISVEKSAIYFNGFYTQGSGSSFSGVADFKGLEDAINRQSWKELMPELELPLSNVTIPKSIRRLFDEHHLEIHPKITSSTRGYHVTAHLIYEIIGKRAGYPRIEECMNQLEHWFDQVVETCNNYLYKILQDTYESLTSDEQVKDTIEANQYDFTIDGQIATRLLRLSQN